MRCSDVWLDQQEAAPQYQLDGALLFSDASWRGLPIKAATNQAVHCIICQLYFFCMFFAFVLPVQLFLSFVYHSLFLYIFCTRSFLYSFFVVRCIFVIVYRRVYLCHRLFLVLVMVMISATELSRFSATIASPLAMVCLTCLATTAALQPFLPSIAVVRRCSKTDYVRLAAISASTCGSADVFQNGLPSSYQLLTVFVCTVFCTRPFLFLFASWSSLIVSLLLRH